MSNTAEYERIGGEICRWYNKSINYSVDVRDTPRETLLLLQSVLDLVEEQSSRITVLTEKLSLAEERIARIENNCFDTEETF